MPQKRFSVFFFILGKTSSLTCYRGNVYNQHYYRVYYFHRFKVYWISWFQILYFNFLIRIFLLYKGPYYSEQFIIFVVVIDNRWIAVCETHLTLPLEGSQQWISRNLCGCYNSRTGEVSLTSMARTRGSNGWKTVYRVSVTEKSFI